MRTGLIVGSLEVKENIFFQYRLQRLFFGAAGLILKSWSAGGGRKESERKKKKRRRRKKRR